MAKTIDDRLEKIDERLDKVAESVGQIKNEVASLSTAMKVAGAIASLLILAAVGLYLFAGEAVMERVSRRVFREELAFRKTVVQAGKFEGLDKATSQDPLQFTWNLQSPVDKADLISMVTNTSQPLPKIEISTQLSDDGKKCIMTLRGAPDALAAIKYPVDAWVTIDARQSIQ